MKGFGSNLAWGLSRGARSASVAGLVLATAGCGFRDCGLGIAHRDCAARAPIVADFPQDDAACRSYGLTPGTRSYEVCRRKKSHEQLLTGQATDYGAVQEPLTPTVR